MKHETHIYLAEMAIKFTRDSVKNLRKANGTYLTGGDKGRETKDAEARLRALRYYQHFIREASWVPDDVLHDNDPNHIFKLFTSRDFPGHGLNDKPVFKKNGKVYRKFAGALPYRIDHIARSIVDMEKLRDHNDRYSMEQILYNYLLLSHYIADAHVPMHCDLRDDPPSQGRSSDPSRRSRVAKPKGKYLKSSAHNALEKDWDEAVKIAKDQEAEQTDLSKAVFFEPADCDKGGLIKPVIIKKNGLMDFMIDVCITSKERSQKLFPASNPQVRNDRIMESITEEIFADCIGNLISIWRFLWQKH